jgi:hypothetical protein
LDTTALHLPYQTAEEKRHFWPEIQQIEFISIRRKVSAAIHTVIQVIKTDSAALRAFHGTLLIHPPRLPGSNGLVEWEYVLSQLL